MYDESQEQLQTHHMWMTAGEAGGNQMENRVPLELADLEVEDSMFLQVDLAVHSIFCADTINLWDS
jgi:hypothetical protein